MVAPVSITLPRPALGCGRRHNIGDQSRLRDMTTVAAPSRATRLGKSCLRSGACALSPLHSCRAAEKIHADHCCAGEQRFFLHIPSPWLVALNLVETGHVVERRTRYTCVSYFHAPALLTIETWKIFLHNHVEEIASIDLFVVPTIPFQQLFVFLVLGHRRRQLLWFAVTQNPTAEWLARPITELFAFGTSGHAGPHK